MSGRQGAGLPSDPPSLLLPPSMALPRESTANYDCELMTRDTSRPAAQASGYSFGAGRFPLKVGDINASEQSRKRGYVGFVTVPFVRFYEPAFDGRMMFWHSSLASYRGYCPTAQTIV